MRVVTMSRGTVFLCLCRLGCFKRLDVLPKLRCSGEPNSHRKKKKKRKKQKKKKKANNCAKFLLCNTHTHLHTEYKHI